MNARKEGRARRGRGIAIESWAMAAVALGLRLRRPDLTQDEVVTAAMDYMRACFDQVKSEGLDNKAHASSHAAVLQHLRDMEHKRTPFAKVVLSFHDPRIGLDMRPLILESVEAAMETLPPRSN